MQNNGAMKVVNFTHAQTAETRHSFHPSVNAGYKANVVPTPLQGTRGPWQLRLCIACNNATDIELHVHTYAVGVADKAACEGSSHYVLHYLV